ncbi:HD domain-containing protein [Catalinimonas niigatensis]|uniref:HD domain-containing protein n=1 Tax=Catalinimonas niigatensis TaxID=1397264 RepID=UPI0026669874|nr:HD domain-containing protein [Catalinimonas niigatensis]WPP48365.1 HD domain-containing protein [Catalinimonas niigatensis]
MDRDLHQQIAFMMETDKLKRIIRRNYNADGSRLENTAEHSWQITLMALTLSEHAEESIDITKVIKMLLIHDLVEIDAGDTYLYGEFDLEERDTKEQQAAERIFGLLPEYQQTDFMKLWQEFEAIETPEARFAKAIDRLMPILNNYHSGGRSWKENNISREQVLDKCSGIQHGSEKLWAYAQKLIDQAKEKGYLK